MSALALADVIDEISAIEAELTARIRIAQSLEQSIPQKMRPWLRKARYKGAHGGRGSAKSWTAARLLIARCIRRPGTRWVCVREIQNSLRESVKRLLDDVIKEFKLTHLFRTLETQILTPGGGMIVFLGMQNHTSDSIKSLEGFDGAWVEEAQSLSVRSLTLLRPTIRKAGSEIWFTWNPDTKKDPVDDFLRINPPADAVVVEINFRDNPYFPQELQAEMEIDRERDIDKYNHVWLGQYQTVSGARVFTNWKVVAFETRSDAAFLHGADWGFAIDPTVLVRGWVDGRTLYIDAEVYQVGCEIDDTPALFDKMPGARAWPIIADSARPETISYMQKHGYPRIEPARKGAGSVEEGINFLKTYNIVVHPRCENCIDELASYSYKKHPQTEEIMPILEDRKNHVIDSMRYMVEKLHKKQRLNW
jgi:phage terminase large subunit